MADNFDDIFTSNTTESAKNNLAPNKSNDDIGWAEKKQIERDQVRNLLDTTSKKVVGNGVAFKEFLDVSARLNLYSTGNTLLILAQKPNATKLADYEKWGQEGSPVKKGEKGVNIIEPGKEYTREDGSVAYNYNIKKVFDISQTNAEQKTQPKVMRDERTLLKALMDLSPTAINVSENIPENLNALYQPQEKAIFVRKGMDGQSIFRALSKEIAHARLDKGSYNRNNSDFNASAVSYVLSKRNGIDVSDYDFSKMPPHFANLDAKEIRSELSSIRSVSDEMIKEMDSTLNPPHKNKSKDTPER